MRAFPSRGQSKPLSDLYYDKPTVVCCALDFLPMIQNVCC